MTPIEAIDYFKAHNKISEETLNNLSDNDSFRMSLYSYFIDNKDREFALALIEELKSRRKDINFGIGIEELMFASYILGFHKQVEDCLKVWEAKEIDFDTYCGIDIQLVPFAGVQKTLSFLSSRNDETSKRAYEYILGCEAAGDFDFSYSYYSVDNLPWWI